MCVAKITQKKNCERLLNYRRMLTRLKMLFLTSLLYSHVLIIHSGKTSMRMVNELGHKDNNNKQEA